MKVCYILLIIHQALYIVKQVKYLDKASGSPNLYIQCQQNREYSALLYDRKDYKAAYEHNNQYILLRDSIEHLYLPDKLAEVEARYNHEKLINEKNKEEKCNIYFFCSDNSNAGTPNSISCPISEETSSKTNND